MKKPIGLCCLFGLVIGSFFLEPATAKPRASASVATALQLTPQEARAMGERMVIFGYTLVAFYQTLRSVKHPKSYRFERHLSDVSQSGPAPNYDTVTATVVLDLRTEPMVLQVPAIRDRYYSIQFMDATQDEFGAVGTRSTGNQAGTFLIAGPDWRGTVPPTIKQVLRSPSSLAIAPLRVAISNQADLARVLQLEPQIQLMPLSRFLNQKSPAVAPISWPPNYNPQTGNLDGFLRTLTFMMRWHRFSPLDQMTLTELAKIGLRPGQDFQLSALSPDLRANLEAGFVAGRTLIARSSATIGPVWNGWQFLPDDTGDFGPDYVTRAAVAWTYPEAQSPKEVLYATARLDRAGQPLQGQHRYVLTFPSNQTPPTQVLWSITLYDQRRDGIVPNSIQRYAISNRTPGLKSAADGSLPIYIQASSPRGQQQSNWLPAPTGPFYLVLRIYAPQPVALKRQWLPPAVQRVED